MPMSKDEVQAEVEKGQAVLALAIVLVSQAVQAAQPVQIQAVQAAQVEAQQSDQPESELLGGTGPKPNYDDQKQGEQKNDDDQKQGEQKQSDHDGDHDENML